MTRLASFAAFCVAALVSAPAVAQGIEILDLYARAASPSAKAGAAFMMIRNTSDQEDRLLAAQSTVSVRTELHTHEEVSDGVMRMTRIDDGIAIPPGATHHMARGGDHVMLMGLTESLTDGAEIMLTLTFEHAGAVEVTVPVDNTRAPAGHGH